MTSAVEKPTMTSVMEALTQGFAEIGRRLDGMEANFSDRLASNERRLRRTENKLGKVSSYLEKRIESKLM